MLNLGSEQTSIVVMPEAGAAIVGWTDAGTHVLRRAHPDAVLRGNVRGLGCFPMLPYCNRIEDGCFAWNGVGYRLDPGFGDQRHALHGVGFRQPWNVQQASPGEIVLTLEHDAIDGRADGLPLGTADPGWTGFHALEYALWHGSGAAASLANGLVDSVNGLIADFPSEEVDPGDLPLRAHEILENAMQFQLTGDADYGSGSTLDTLYANTQGTAAVLRALTPLITPRDPGLLRTIDTDLAAVQRALLTRESRQRLDGRLGGLLEELAKVPDLLAPRTSG